MTIEKELLQLTEDFVTLTEEVATLKQRQRILEEAFVLWNEFMTTEMINIYVDLGKHKNSDKYFKDSLRQRWKDIYDRFEKAYANRESIKYTNKYIPYKED